jgi:antitoxin component of RelBE/YafQ-DinJ toxin-antitoxin module
MDKEVKEWAAKYAENGGMSLSSLVRLLLVLLRRDRIRIQLLIDAEKQSKEQEEWEDPDDERNTLLQDWGIPADNKEETLG